ncbi:MAG: hypothetical protein K0R62_876 [Nonomuraea muscovyensis]|nr:hypothetical protein [Nonomuraea muscovyensis]
MPGSLRATPRDSPPATANNPTTQTGMEPLSQSVHVPSTALATPAPASSRSGVRSSLSRRPAGPRRETPTRTGRRGTTTEKVQVLTVIRTPGSSRLTTVAGTAASRATTTAHRSYWCATTPTATHSSICAVLQVNDSTRSAKTSITAR